MQNPSERVGNIAGVRGHSADRPAADGNGSLTHEIGMMVAVGADQGLAADGEET